VTAHALEQLEGQQPDERTFDWMYHNRGTGVNVNKGEIRFPNEAGDTVVTVAPARSNRLVCRHSPGSQCVDRRETRSPDRTASVTSIRRDILIVKAAAQLLLRNRQCTAGQPNPGKHDARSGLRLAFCHASHRTQGSGPIDAFSPTSMSNMPVSAPALLPDTDGDRVVGPVDTQPPWHLPTARHFASCGTSTF